MTLDDLLASVLNPGGRFSNGGGMAPPVAPSFDRQQPFGQSRGVQNAPQLGGRPPQAPQLPQMGQPAPQAAPAPAAAPSGGGLGDFLGNLIAPQHAAKNRTVGWLQQQGMDQGLATLVASDKSALRSYLLDRGKGNDFAERAAAADQYGMEQNSEARRNYILTGKLPEAKEREIRNDANGVPRYTDNGAAVYPSDQSASGGTQFFSGRSVEAQGLNFLIDKGTLSKEQAANVAAGKSVTGPNGEVIFMTPQGIYQQPSAGGAPSPVQPGGASPQLGGNIPITGPKYSEDMRKAGGFALRAAEADKIVGDPKISEAGASYGENLKAAAPLGIGNYLVSEDYQKYDQAQRDFVNAVLRRESGAAISESEFQNARKQYFPQPGDGQEVVQQKARNRQLAVQSLHQSADPVPSLTGASGAPPALPTPATPSAGDAPPASYTGDPALWKFMTPEDRKLWP